ncbi:MAG TPA: 2-hydroxyacid dehydrogenase [Bacteroidales bacterium]|nr:hydroxyacid dehydrogenase [Bacteroidales bacterium]HQH59221.1 2-hydroxyacid dehydrogenase [Bacteroidales bacterium]HRC78366.1 2-hydroxyacid dehydrogenase [Bacteroidales bacterium]
MLHNITVTYHATDEEKSVIYDILAGENLFFLQDVKDIKEKQKILLETDILLSWNPTLELKDIEINVLQNLQFVQLLSAGYDHLNFNYFSKKTIIASNQGAYAKPMAEHALAMILALAKKLTKYHNLLSKGVFDQLNSVTRYIHGSNLGIIGYGSIGKETAKLMQPFDVNVYAINTSGKTDDDIAFIGTLQDLDIVLKNSDILLISIPLNKETQALIGKRELELMKSDAILINVARGDIIIEKDLYEHMRTHPEFSAGIDAWWIEPFKYGKFEIHYPFFELTNFIGSPHNSSVVPNSLIDGAKQAAINVKRFINKEVIKGLIKTN